VLAYAGITPLIDITDPHKYSGERFCPNVQLKTV
jgi:hypothetical protein